MIEGRVNANLEAIVVLPIRGADGLYREIEFVIDTGYTGSMTFPSAAGRELGLEPQGKIQAFLADGSPTQYDFYDVEVIWDGETKPVRAGALDSDPTIGAAILYGHDLTIQFRQGGRVLIQAGA